MIGVGTMLEAKADGPPVSADGEILVPYKGFALNAQQKQQLLKSRVITLSDQQAARCGMSLHDRRLFVLTANFNDCTCGMTYGIWFHPDSFAVFGQENASYDTLDNGKLLPARCLRAVANNEGEEEVMTSFYISVEGDLYFEGNKISTERESLETAFEKMQTNIDKLNAPLFARGEAVSESELRKITLYIPPVRGNRQKAKVLETFYLITMMNSRWSLAELYFQ